MSTPSLKTSEYILPNLRENKTPTLSNYIDLSSSEKQSFFNETLKFDNLKEKKRLFIIGEPGFGKSRLMKQLYDSFEKQKDKCCFTDLKDVNNQKHIKLYIEEKIKENSRRKNLRSKINDFKSTRGFKLKNSASIVLFFDGLDEVHPDIAPTLLDDIQNIAETYPLVKIFLTCRTHHVSRYENQLYSFDFHCAELQPFTVHQTIDFLKENNKSLKKFSEIDLSDKLAATNIYNYSFSSYGTQNTLNTPRYLEVLSFLINKKGFEKVIELSRSEIFDLFITERLKKESKSQEKKKQNFSGKIIYLKQCLERLALVMEIQRDNKISKDDFVTFLMDTDLNLDSQILLEVFFDGTILKDEGDFLEFDNTEFQEYLAAKAISRLGKPEQVIMDLAVEYRLGNIYESWNNIVAYLCELKPEVLLPIVNLAYRIDSQELFNFIKYPKKEYFEREDNLRQIIFSKIFAYHSEKKIFLPYKIELFLKNFYSHKNHHHILVESLNKGDDLAKHTNRTNSVNIITQLISHDSIPDSDRSFWKRKFLRYAKEKSIYGESLTIACIKSLGQIPTTITELSKLSSLANHLDKSVRRAFLDVHLKLDPNHPNSIELLIEEIIKDKFSSIYGYNKISTTPGFKYFFNSLLTNKKSNYSGESILSIINEKLDSLFEINNHFFENLENSWDSKLELIVSKILVKSVKEHYNHSSDFCQKLCQIYKAKNKNAIFDFINTLTIKGLKTDHFWTTDILGLLIRPSQVEDIIEFAKENLFHETYTLSVIRESKDPKVKKLERKYYPKIHEESVKYFKKQKKKTEIKKMKLEGKAIDQYNTFIKLLNSQNEETILYFSMHRNHIEPQITTFQKNKFKKLVKLFLKKHDPKDGKIVLKKKNSVSIMSIVLFDFYEKCVKIADNLKVDLSPYRIKILKLISSTIDLDFIYKTVPNPTEEELKSFFDWSLVPGKNRLQNYRIGNILDIQREYGYQNQTKLLETIINNNNIDCGYRCEAIELLFSWNKVHVDFFRNIFKKRSKSKIGSDNYRISLTINRLLIKVGEESAIDWRIKEILKNTYKLSNHFSGIRGVRDEENLGKIIGYLDNPKLDKKILKFLEKSFQFLKRDSEYYKYVNNEIWRPVLDFFRSQKHKKHNLKNYIDALNNLTQKYIHIPLVDRFHYQVELLNREYNLFLGQPTPFAFCIQKYQIIKNKQYLDIAYPEELFSLIKNVINFEFRQWVHQGFYGFIDDLSKTTGSKVEKEKIIQKTIATQFENFLLKKGIRNSDIKEVHPNFYREAELLDGKKVDLIISYGGIGSVMVEIKRADNPELGSAAKLKIYREETFLPYLKQTNCDFGIFLIFKDNPIRPKKFGSKISSVEKAYGDLSNIEVIGIDCTIN